MAELIPFKPGIPQQEFEVTLAGVPYWVETHWNEADQAHYLDLYEVNLDPIAIGLKIVLGCKLGDTYLHPFFVGRALIVVDDSNTGLDARVDDLGGRINVVYFTELDLQLAQSPPLEIPRE